MNDLERLYYILKRQSMLVDQMSHVKKCLDQGKPIQVYNIPDKWTPQALINHYLELYNILEVAKREPLSSLKVWLGKAQKRKVSTFTFNKEIEILQDLTT